MRSWLLLAASIACSTAFCAPITELKSLHPRTEIIAGGEARAAIVAPNDADLMQVAEDLASRLNDLAGKTPEILQDTAVVSQDWTIDRDLIGQRNLIAVGNINSNRLLAVLSGQTYVAADSIYPGPDGYVIRTVHDPFADGMNVLVLAGSDTAGVATAADLFVAKYADPRAAEIVLEEPVVDVKFSNVPERFYPTVDDWQSSKRHPQYSSIEFFRKMLTDSGMMDENGVVIGRDSGNLVTVLNAIGRIGQSYFWRGDPDLPPLMKQVLDANRDLLSVVPPRVEMEAAAAAMMGWWDNVEELPVWTDQDRLDITNAFLADALQGYERRAAHSLVDEGYVQVVDENHGTNSALNTFHAWYYFDKYYDLPDTEYWMNVARATFAGQSASFQVLEDSSGYLCYCPRHAMSYALASGDLTYFQRGIAKSQADYIAQVCVNNLGYSTGFGDGGSLVQPSIYEAISFAAWYYRDPKLSWVLHNQMLQACGLRSFQYPIPYDLTVQDARPDDWDGMTVFPIWMETLRKGEGSKTIVYDPREIAGPEWFSKIAFREGWSPEDQYLLFDGAGTFHQAEGYPPGPAGHKHDDINTIINFTSEDRMWLVDHTYGSARSIKDHSGLYIARNGAVGYPEHEAKLQEAVDAGDVALCRSVYEGFSGADWERSIFWRPGQPFVVIDRALAREPGRYVVRCSFRGLGLSALDGARMRLSQDGKYCDIVSDGRGRNDVEPFEYDAPDEWTRYYEYAKPVVRIFQEDKSADLAPGEAICFANMIQAADSQEALDALQLTPVSDSAVIVKTGAGSTLYGVGAPPDGSAETGTYAISTDSALYGGLSRLGPADDPLFTSDKPIDLFVKPGQVAWVEADEPTTIHLRDSETPLRIAAGRQDLPADAIAGPVAELTAAVMSNAQSETAAYAASATANAEEEPFNWRTTTIDLGTPLTAMKVADINTDGANEWLVAGDEGVTAFAADGSRLWQFTPGQPCRTVDAADVDGDGAMEVAVGCDDEHVYLLSAGGEERWSFACKSSTASIGLPPRVDMVRIADLDGDGQQEIVAGANWVHCIAADGSLKWEKYLRFARGMICGDFLQGAVADINGDGKLEVLALFLYSYNQALAFDADGNIVLPADYDNDRKFGINIDLPNAVMVTNLFGDDREHFVVGGSRSLYLHWAGGEHAGVPGAKRGGAYVALAQYRQEGEAPIVFAADDMGAIVALRASPRDDEWINIETVWSSIIGRKITSLTVFDADGDGTDDLVAGLKDGSVRVLDALTGESKGVSAPSDAPVAGFSLDGDRMLVLCDDGHVEIVPAG